MFTLINCCFLLKCDCCKFIYESLLLPCFWVASKMGFSLFWQPATLFGCMSVVVFTTAVVIPKQILHYII